MNPTLTKISPKTIAMTLAAFGVTAGSALALCACGKLGIGKAHSTSADQGLFSSLPLQTFPAENLALNSNALIVWKLGVTSEQQIAFSAEASKFEKAITISLTGIELKKQGAQLAAQAKPYLDRQAEFKKRGEALQARKQELVAQKQELEQSRALLTIDQRTLVDDQAKLAADQSRLQDPSLTPEARLTLQGELAQRAAALETQKTSLQNRMEAITNREAQLHGDEEKAKIDDAQLQTEVTQLQSDPGLLAIQVAQVKLQKQRSRLTADAAEAIQGGAPIDPEGDFEKTGKAIIRHKYTKMAQYVTHFAHPIAIQVNFDRSKTNPDVVIVGWTFSPEQDAKLLELMTSPQPKTPEEQAHIEQIKNDLTLASVPLNGKAPAIINTLYTPLGGKVEFEVIGPTGRYWVRAERNDTTQKWYNEERLKNEGPALKLAIQETQSNLIDEVRAIQGRINDARQNNTAPAVADVTTLVEKQDALKSVSTLSTIQGKIADMTSLYSFYGSGMRYMGNDGFEANGTVRRMTGPKPISRSK